MCSKFGQIQSGTTELAALEHLKNAPFSRFTFVVIPGNSQVSVYRTIGPLVLIFVLKHRLWVVVRTASVIYFLSKIKKIIIIFI